MTTRPHAWVSKLDAGGWSIDGTWGNFEDGHDSCHNGGYIHGGFKGK